MDPDIFCNPEYSLFSELAFFHPDFGGSSLSVSSDVAEPVPKFFSDDPELPPESMDADGDVKAKQENFGEALDQYCGKNENLSYMTSEDGIFIDHNQVLSPGELESDDQYPNCESSNQINFNRISEVGAESCSPGAIHIRASSDSSRTDVPRIVAEISECWDDDYDKHQVDRKRKSSQCNAAKKRKTNLAQKEVQNTGEDIGKNVVVSDLLQNPEQLAIIKTQALNKLLIGTSKKECKAVKVARRKLKNRDYAKNTRIKKLMAKQDDKKQIEADRKQVEADRKQLEADRKQFEADRKQVETDRKQVEAERRQVEVDRKQLEAEGKQVEAERRQVEVDRKQLEANRKQVMADRKQVEDERRQVEVDRKQLEADRKQLEADRKQVEVTESKLRKKEDKLK